MKKIFLKHLLFIASFIFFEINTVNAQLYADPPLPIGLLDVGIGKAIPEGRLHINRLNCRQLINDPNFPLSIIDKRHIVLESTTDFNCGLLENPFNTPPLSQKWTINGENNLGLQLNTTYDGQNFIDLALFNEVHTYLYAQEFSFVNILDMTPFQSNFKSQFNLINGKVGIGGVTSTDFNSGNESLIVKGSIVIIDPSNNSKQFKLESNGFLHAREILVDMDNIPDYVFKDDYKLMPLDSLQKFIEREHHLPGIKSEKEYEAEGNIKLRELNLKLLEKIEELTLYIINQEKKIDALELKVR